MRSLIGALRNRRTTLVRAAPSLVLHAFGFHQCVTISVTVRPSGKYRRRPLANTAETRQRRIAKPGPHAARGAYSNAECRSRFGPRRCGCELPTRGSPSQTWSSVLFQTRCYEEHTEFRALLRRNLQKYGRRGTDEDPRITRRAPSKKLSFGRSVSRINHDCRKS